MESDGITSNDSRIYFEKNNSIVDIYIVKIISADDKNIHLLRVAPKVAPVFIVI